MSFLNTKPPGFSPEGYHTARCISIVEYGTIFIVSKWQAQVRLTWELPKDTRIYTVGSPPRPKQLSKEYASNLYGKSHLKRHLLNWRGEDIVQKLDEKFEPSLIVGQPCYIKIEHRRNASTGAWYEDISDLEPCQEKDCPPQFNPSRVLTYENFDQNIFNQLPNFVAHKIMSSKEFQTLRGVTYVPTRPVAENPF